MQRFFRGLVTGLLLLVLPAAWAADDFLPPEQAFKVSAQMVAADRIEVLVRIAPRYYAYREPLRFTAQGDTHVTIIAEPPAASGLAQIELSMAVSAGATISDIAIRVISTTLAAHVGAVAVAPTTIALKIGDTQQFQATVRDTDQQVMTLQPTWTVETATNAVVGVIDGSGTFIAQRPGTCTVVALCGGKRGEATVTVAEPPPPAQHSVPVATITVDGNGDDWAGISPLLTDPVGDGGTYGGLDIIAIYMAHDAQRIYFRIDRQSDALAPNEQNNYWLYQRPTATGTHGYAIECFHPANGQREVRLWNTGANPNSEYGAFQRITSNLTHSFNGGIMEIAVPKNLLVLDPSYQLKFYTHHTVNGQWQHNGDINDTVSTVTLGTAPPVTTSLDGMWDVGEPGYIMQIKGSKIALMAHGTFTEGGQAYMYQGLHTGTITFAAVGSNTGTFALDGAEPNIITSQPQNPNQMLKTIVTIHSTGTLALENNTLVLKGTSVEDDGSVFDIDARCTRLPEGPYNGIWAGLEEYTFAIAGTSISCHSQGSFTETDGNSSLQWYYQGRLVGTVNAQGAFQFTGTEVNVTLQPPALVANVGITTTGTMTRVGANISATFHSVESDGDTYDGTATLTPVL